MPIKNYYGSLLSKNKSKEVMMSRSDLWGENIFELKAKPADLEDIGTVWKEILICVRIIISPSF